jgi:transcriptional regulator with XRE-family HTH domain
VPNVYARTLKAAAELIGSEEELARRLGLSGADLALWMRGCGAPPLATLLKAANLLTDSGAAASPGHAPRALRFLRALWRLGTLGMILKMR